MYWNIRKRVPDATEEAIQKGLQHSTHGAKAVAFVGQCSGGRRESVAPTLTITRQQEVYTAARQSSPKAQHAIEQDLPAVPCVKDVLIRLRKPLRRMTTGTICLQWVSSSHHNYCGALELDGVKLTDTVRELKRRLASEHPDSPAVGQIELRAGGEQLHNTLTVEEADLLAPDAEAVRALIAGPALSRLSMLS